MVSSNQMAVGPKVPGKTLSVESWGKAKTVRWREGKAETLEGETHGHPELPPPAGGTP